MMKKVFYIFATVLLVFGSLVFKNPKAMAFDPSIIIDDATFENYTSMTANQIDNFLNSFSSSCISSTNGFTTPDPQGWSTFTNSYQFGPNVSAGTAIADTAQLYHVNPQVILATLQKEQTIVTGAVGCHPNSPDPNAPFSDTPAQDKTFTCAIRGQQVTCTYACTFSGGCMNIAVGYDCPGYCKASNEGFSKQITLGTWLLRFGEERSEGITSGYAGYEAGDNGLGYSGPMAAHGNFDGTYTTQDGYHLTLTQGASATLYNFTPYESGNANFYNIFTGWFGASYSPDLYTDTDRDGTVDRYDQCGVTYGTQVNFGCPDNTTLESSGYSGDFNGDGKGDVAFFSVNPDGHSFNIYIMYGSANGLGQPTFIMTLGPNNLGFDYQKSKVVATDVNHDGKADLVIFHKGPHNEIDINTLIGTSSGLQQQGGWTLELSSSTGWLWTNIRTAGAGDFNGDGYGDAMLFSVNPDGHGFNIYNLYGSSGGLQAPVFQLSLTPSSGGWDFKKSKPATVDITGDGYTDLAILHQGPNDEIYEHIFAGSSSGVQADNPNLVKVLSPSQGWKWSQVKIAGVGDFNADGYGDVTVLSQFPDGNTYNIQTLNGSSNGMTPQLQKTLGFGNGGWSFWKTKVVATNDNGDNYADLVIFHQGPSDEIWRHVFQGSPSGLSEDPNQIYTWWPNQGWRWGNIRFARTNN